MKTEGSKEHLAYMEAKKNYLAVGKRYSALLLRVMNCDPSLLKIAEDILVTGDGLSVHDNRFLAAFYKELRSKSKIDKKYFDLLLELKKTRNELEHASHALSRLRVGYILRRSGIPPKRSNQGIDAVTSLINNPDIALLEKISMPDVLDVTESENLEESIINGDVECGAGQISGKTKAGREYIRGLERRICQRVNDDYFLDNSTVDVASYVRLDKRNLLDFVRASADWEHVREIERKIASRDIRLQDRDLIAVTPKGEKYLALLREELSAKLDKKVRAQTVQANAGYVKKDPRLAAIHENLADLDIAVGKHARVGLLAKDIDAFQRLYKVASARKDQIKAALADVMITQETISASFADVKRQLAGVVDQKCVDIEKLLSLLVAVRYISLFENQYESKLAKVESLLGHAARNHPGLGGPDTLTKISEKYGAVSEILKSEAEAVLRSLINSRLAGRHDLGAETNELLAAHLLKSPQFTLYREILQRQEAARRHVVDTLYGNDSLYEGLDDMSEVISEIAELEIEKKECMADLAHELELAHKEMWLAKIKNNNGKYIDSGFAELSREVKSKARLASSEAVASARNEIQETLSRYRDDHKYHSDDFGKFLRQSLSEITRGEDVGKISTNLKNKYKELTANHQILMEKMEKDIILLEQRLLVFEERTPAEIEKMLMTDIRANI